MNRAFARRAFRLRVGSPCSATARRHNLTAVGWAWESTSSLAVSMPNLYVVSRRHVRSTFWFVTMPLNGGPPPTTIDPAVMAALAPVPLNTMIVLSDNEIVNDAGVRLTMVTMVTQGGQLHGWIDRQTLANVARQMQMRASGLIAP